METMLPKEQITTRGTASGLKGAVASDFVKLKERRADLERRINRLPTIRNAFERRAERAALDVLRDDIAVQTRILHRNAKRANGTYENRKED